MNITELRTELQTLLIEDLGYYTFANNAGVAPAIAVLDSGDTVVDRTVSGLEVIVRRMPIRDEGKAMFDCVRASKTWQVFLVQWQGNHTLQNAIDKIRRKFPNTIALPAKIEKGIGIREMIALRIVDNLDADDWL
jgi:hypothetical protein